MVSAATLAKGKYTQEEHKQKIADIALRKEYNERVLTFRRKDAYTSVEWSGCGFPQSSYTRNLVPSRVLFIGSRTIKKGYLVEGDQVMGPPPSGEISIFSQKLVRYLGTGLVLTGMA